MSSPPTKHHKDLAKRDKKIILSLLLIALVIAGVFGAGHGVFAVDNRSIL